MSQRQKRQFEKNLPRGAVPGRIWRNIVFAHILQNKLQTAVEKGSLNRPIPLLISLESSSLLNPSKSRAQTTLVQQQWSRLHIRLAKINYLAKKRRRSGQQDLMYSSDGKSASRNHRRWYIITPEPSHIGSNRVTVALALFIPGNPNGRLGYPHRTGTGIIL